MSPVTLFGWSLLAALAGILVFALVGAASKKFEALSKKFDAPKWLDAIDILLSIEILLGFLGMFIAGFWFVARLF